DRSRRSSERRTESSSSITKTIGCSGSSPCGPAGAPGGSRLDGGFGVIDIDMDSARHLVGISLADPLPVTRRSDPAQRYGVRGPRAIRPWSSAWIRVHVCYYRMQSLMISDLSRTRPLIAIVDDEESIRKSLRRLLMAADLDT